jgi:hypothetical protein
MFQRTYFLDTPRAANKETLKRVNKIGKIIAILLTWLFSFAARADAQGPSPHDQIFELSSVAKVNTAVPIVVVRTSGRFGTAGWRQRLLLFSSENRRLLLYSDELVDGLHYIEFYPRLSRFESVDGADMILLTYLMGVDGDDPMELKMVMFYKGKAYLAQAPVSLNEVTGAETIGKVNISRPIPKVLKQLYREAWNRIASDWKQESSREEVEWQRKGFTLPIGQK